MSVVGSDYDELKQYNLAEIYDPSPKIEGKTNNGAAPELESKDDNPPSNVVAKRPGSMDDVLPTEKS